MKTKVYKLEVLIIDHDDSCESEIVSAIENTKYPNWCISPTVVNVKSVEVDWSDKHPLNNSLTKDEEYARLFPICLGAMETFKKENGEIVNINDLILGGFSPLPLGE